MYKLTEEGKEYLKNGLPEKQLLKFLETDKPLAEVVKLPKAQIAIGWARKNKWIAIENGVVKLTEEGKKASKEKIPEEKALEEVDKKGESEAEMIKILLSRNLIEEAKEIAKEKKPSFWQKILSIFSKKKTEPKIIKSEEIAQLTPELIKSGEWKNIPFRKYDVNAPAPKIFAGKKQPFIQFVEDVKEKLIGLGFEEMKGPLVETSFWNCDALFTPQDHPSKDIHDIFYLKNPTIGNLPDENLVAKVKATHEGGWITESTGWGGIWNKENASKLILRSHTTAVSARTLFKVGDNPGKYFTIDRNFRPDVIDAQHLMEFYQCEGIVVGENLTFRHLLGFFKEIAESLGIREIKFQPSYFPFTEPSVQCLVKHPTLGWIETMPGGMFRPELLRPLGIEKSQVLAWGIGINRLAMIKLGIDDIRMLFSDDLEWLRNFPMVK
jgi:phenylalanyl-tRNA synthetase alpha chain